MATPTYSINGTTFHGVKANWRRVVKRKLDTGAIEYQPFLIHTWDIEQQGMTAALVAQALGGNIITSLATTDVDDVNNGAIYTTVELVSMANFDHEGIMAKGIKLEFRIKP